MAEAFHSVCSNMFCCLQSRVGFFSRVFVQIAIKKAENTARTDPQRPYEDQLVCGLLWKIRRGRSAYVCLLSCFRGSS